MYFKTSHVYLYLSRAQTNKSLRELGNHADNIERNLEMLDSDVKKNESNRFSVFLYLILHVRNIVDIDYSSIRP